jgi:hypothetical protein
VPTNSGVRCVIVGTGGHGRPLAEALEVANDVGVLAVHHVLVPQCGSGGRVQIRAMSAFKLVPLAAASVAAVCRKSWNRNPLMPTSVVAGSHTRRRKLLRRIG